MGSLLRQGFSRSSWVALLLVIQGCTAILSRAPEPREALTLIQEARFAYERGDDALVVARANEAIARAPGDALLAEAQLLLARSYYRRGEETQSADQYRLFLTNYPNHPASREALSRAAAIARRTTQRSVSTSTMFRWRIVTIAPDSRSSIFPRGVPDARASGTTGLVFAIGSHPSWDHVRTAVDRAALEGYRALLWMSLADGETPFDPFDAGRLTVLEARYREAAEVPIDGFVVGRDLFLDEEAPGIPVQEVIRATFGADRMLASLSDRGAWQWAGLRARASASALSRVVAAARPGLIWMVAVSSTAVLRPWEAIVERGEDIAELLRRVPSLSLIVVGTDDHAAVQARLATLGVPLTALVWESRIEARSSDGPYLVVAPGLEP